MSQPIVQVDAFTDRPFRGNPAAVCLLDGPAPEEWMQAVALELNLSETAFLHPVADGFALRWFTPTVEVDLCGHATLASAHVLWTDGHLAPDGTARFHTSSGLLTAQRAGDWIELDFPATPAATVEPPDGLLPALDAPVRWGLPRGARVGSGRPRSCARPRAYRSDPGSRRHGHQPRRVLGV
jgi:predicted PhzF superfamily epimerase YddE/YHI9